MYNIVRLERYARKQLKQDQQSAVILFDIKAAFDSVWHDGLIYKLHNLRLPQYLIRYIIAFLSRRTASIELENRLSHPFQLKSGTPQGSHLSPLLPRSTITNSVYDRSRLYAIYYYSESNYPFWIVYDLFLENHTAIMCSDVKTINFRCIREWSYPSVNDTEKYGRNTEPGITEKYDDIRSQTPYLAVCGRKREWMYDLGVHHLYSRLNERHPKPYGTWTIRR